MCLLDPSLWFLGFSYSTHDFIPFKDSFDHWRMAVPGPAARRDSQRNPQRLSRLTYRPAGEAGGPGNRYTNR
jgi:hypothetical protein